MKLQTLASVKVVCKPGTRRSYWIINPIGKDDADVIQEKLFKVAGQ